MNAFVFQADLHCDACAASIKARLDAEGKRPENLSDESTFDSDDYPKGPYPDGGGESDSPQHCGTCHVFLHNPLTPDGVDYAVNALREHLEGSASDADVLDQWAEELADYNLKGEPLAVLNRYRKKRGK